ncbi:MAG: type I-D CRISPR-associated protein Cas7/Csc2 [Candidatus Nanohalobium sp.]
MEIKTPNKGTVEDFKIMRKRKPTVTLVVKRDITEPTLFRNSSDDRAETQEFGDQLHAQVNGEKFTSKERLTGLDLLRQLKENQEVDLIHDNYTYNEPGKLSESINLDALTYGLAGTSQGDGDSFAIKSRVIEGYTYTSEEYDLMNKESRNALYETGTMKNDDNEQAQSLFEYVKVQPGNSFIHFITLEAATPEMLLYTVYNILNTSRYGAKETRTGRNVKNKIIGVITGDHDTALSTGELLMEYNDSDDIVENVKDYVNSVSQDNWTTHLDELPGWLEKMQDIVKREEDEADNKMAKAFKSVTEDAKEELNG